MEPLHERRQRIILHDAIQTFAVRHRLPQFLSYDCRAGPEEAVPHQGKVLLHGMQMLWRHAEEYLWHPFKIGLQQGEALSAGAVIDRGWLNLGCIRGCRQNACLSGSLAVTHLGYADGEGGPVH